MATDLRTHVQSPESYNLTVGGAIHLLSIRNLLSLYLVSLSLSIYISLRLSLYISLAGITIRVGAIRRKKVKIKVMDFMQKMVFPVRRVWIAVASRVKSRNSGKGLLKLHDDIQTCGYEDVQVMWQMLRTSDSEMAAPKRKHRPFWRVFIISNHSPAPAK